MDEQHPETITQETTDTETTAQEETYTHHSPTYTALQPVMKDYLIGGYHSKGLELTDYLLARIVALLQEIATTQESIAQTAQGVGLATSDIADAVQGMGL